MSRMPRQYVRSASSEPSSDSVSGSNHRAPARSLPPQARTMLRLQQTIGNSGVLQLMKAAANSVIQGKFVYDKESTLFFDEDTGRHYRLLGTVPYGESGRRVYQLEGDIDDVLVYQDTMELAERLNHPPEPIADPLSGSPSGVFSGDSAPGDNSAVTFGKPGVKRIFKLSEKESDGD